MQGEGMMEASEGLIVRIPFPDPALNPNKKNGKHWAATLSAKYAVKSTAYKATLAAVGSRSVVSMPTSMTITFVSPDRRRRDIDNLLASSKFAIDSICGALGIDDNCFSEIIIRREYAKDAGETVIEIQGGLF